MTITHTPQDTHLDPEGFRSGDKQLSQLRFYSIGIVAAAKALSSKEIEVYPTEELPLLQGELDDAQDTFKATGVTADGKNYNSQIKMANTIRASWLPFCDSQRLTAPDVRRGEAVMIYQFGDADKYYWTTLKNDNKLRKLETVIWAFSATQKEGDDITPETSYFFEVSAHKGLVTFHTSQANNEAFGYDVQINTKESKVIITDTAGNEIMLDSPAVHLRVKNSAGSLMEVIRNVANIVTTDEVNVKTTRFTVDSQTSTINGQEVTVNGGQTTVNSTRTNINGTSKITLATPSLSAPR